MNELKRIFFALAVAVSLIVFGEKASLPHLLIGGLIVLAALLMNEWGAKRAAARSQAVESAA